MLVKIEDMLTQKGSQKAPFVSFFTSFLVFLPRKKKEVKKLKLGLKVLRISLSVCMNYVNF